MGSIWLKEASERARGETKATSTETRGSRMYCVQREDDVLFVPAGWGHSTLNLQESIGIASFFLDENAVGYRPTKFFHSIRGIRSLQTSLGISSPSDFDVDGHP